MAGFGDSHTAEIDGQYIECSIGGALENAGQPSDERISSVRTHGIYHQSTGSASAQGFHQCGRQGTYELVVDSAPVDEGRDSLNQKIHTAGSAENADGYQNGNQVWNDADGGLKPFFRSVDEGVVDIDFFPYTRQDKSDDDDEQEDIGKGGRVGVYLCPAQGGEEIDDTADKQAGSSQEQQDSPVEQIDALVEADRDNT